MSHENQISDLIAFLAALDSEPLIEAFGLSGTHCYVEREELLDKGSGRADLIVRDESGPMALLEIKVGAAQHGDQFARYDSWAKAQTPPARCYLIGLDEGPLGAPSDWAVSLLSRFYCAAGKPARIRTRPGSRLVPLRSSKAGSLKLTERSAVPPALSSPIL